MLAKLSELARDLGQFAKLAGISAGSSIAISSLPMCLLSF
jgi:hypothetical protein